MVSVCNYNDKGDSDQSWAILVFMWTDASWAIVFMWTNASGAILVFMWTDASWAIVLMWTGAYEKRPYVLNMRSEEQNTVLHIFCLFCEYINLAYVRVSVIYRVHQAEYGIHILVAASQEYVNTYSTRTEATPT